MKNPKAGKPQRRPNVKSLVETRFEATIHPGRNSREGDWAIELNIDRVPDNSGRVRALIGFEELVRLLDQGYEVRLYHAHRQGPLDPALVQPDESFQKWLDERLSSTRDLPMPKPFIDLEGD